MPLSDGSGATPGGGAAGSEASEASERAGTGGTRDETTGDDDGGEGGSGGASYTAGCVRARAGRGRNDAVREGSGDWCAG